MAVPIFDFVGVRGKSSILQLGGNLWILAGCIKASVHIYIYIYLTEHLVHKLLIIMTRFFVSCNKIPVVLKISVLKKLNFVTNFELINNVTKNSNLYVLRVPDTPLVKLSVWMLHRIKYLLLNIISALSY